MSKRSLLERIIALVAIYCVLGALISTPAFANRKQPPPECPPDCSGNDQYFKAAATNNVTINNAAYQNSLPTKDQLIASANAMMAWANARQQDGTLAKAQVAFVNNLNAFYSAPGNGSGVYTFMGPFGNAVPQSVFTAQLQRVTQQERQAIAAYIQTYGLYATVQYFANFMTYLADTYGELQSHGKFRNVAFHGSAHLLFVNDGNNKGRAFLDGLGIVGMAFMIIPGMELLGAGFAIGAAGGIMYMDYMGL